MDSFADFVLILPAFSEFAFAVLQSCCDRFCLIVELTVLGGLNGLIKGGVSPAGTGIVRAGLVGSHSHPQTLLSSGLEAISHNLTYLQFGIVKKIEDGSVASSMNTVLTSFKGICEVFKLGSSCII